MMKSQDLTHLIHQPAWLGNKFLHKHPIVFQNLWHGLQHIFKISVPNRYTGFYVHSESVILARLFTYLTNKRAKMAHYIRKISGPSHGRLTPSYMALKISENKNHEMTTA